MPFEPLLVEDNPGRARLSGEVLVCVEADAKLKTIPVIVLTASQAEMDIAKGFQPNASCCLSSPVNQTNSSS
jgi:CheY-like chemotaxis protein